MWPRNDWLSLFFVFVWTKSWPPYFLTKNAFHQKITMAKVFCFVLKVGTLCVTAASRAIVLASSQANLFLYKTCIWNHLWNASKNPPKIGPQTPRKIQNILPPRIPNPKNPTTNIGFVFAYTTVTSRQLAFESKQKCTFVARVRQLFTCVRMCSSVFV